MVIATLLLPGPSTVLRVLTIMACHCDPQSPVGWTDMRLMMGLRMACLSVSWFSLPQSPSLGNHLPTFA